MNRCKESVLVFLLSVALAACSASHTPRLEVELVTGLVPGPEFARVETRLLRARGGALDAFTTEASSEANARFGDDYVSGHRVAAFEAPLGSYRVLVRLLRLDGSVLASQTTFLIFNASRVLRVHISRDCVGVECPGAGSPALLACLDGRCVDPRCDDAHPEFCPEITFCHDATSCSATAACATASCVDGVCVEEAVEDACPNTEWCDPTPSRGCVPFATMPEGTECGTICTTSANACRFGYWNCDRTPAVCTELANRPSGTSCGATDVCDSIGNCVTCTAGLACSLACTTGTIECDTGAAVCVPSEPTEHLPEGSACRDVGVCVEGTPCVTNGLCAADGTCRVGGGPPGVIVEPPSGLITSESGGTASLMVRLASQPDSDVTISITTSDETEGDVAPGSLTFTHLSWNTAQPLVVTGVDDFMVDGTQDYTVQFAVASLDSNYAMLLVDDVSVMNTDNDMAGITITPTSGLVTTEAGGTATFTVQLDSIPADLVRVAFESSDVTEGLVPEPSLAFTASDWNVPQTVVVTGIDDAITDGDIPYVIVPQPSLSTDADYNGLLAENVSVTNINDDPFPFTQQRYAKASNPGMNDYFGYATALSADGNTMAIGAFRESSGSPGVNGDQSDNSVMYSGAVYVYTRTATSWTQEAYIKASNPGMTDSFGKVIALSADGNTLAVGAYREGSIATGVNGNELDNGAGDAGAAYVFTRTGVTWSQQAYIKASNTDAGDQFAYAISLSGDGDTLAVGAPGEQSIATGIGADQSDDSSSGVGAVYVFTRMAGAWSQQIYIKSSNANFGDGFGYSVDLSGDGDTLAVGATGESSNATGVNGLQSDNSVSYSGAVYVLIRSGIVWAQQAYIKASNPGAFDSFGMGVALSSDGNVLAVSDAQEDSNATGVGGDPFNNLGGESGAVFAFARSGTVWSQAAYIKASNTDSNDAFGTSLDVSADGSTIAVGAYAEASNAMGIDGDQANDSMPGAGAVYVFKYRMGAWSQFEYVKASNPNNNDSFGQSVSLSANAGTMVVGAVQESSNGSSETDNSIPNCGAAYVYFAM